MSKKLQQTLTGAMAAMMATGVVATPVMAATTDVDAIYKAAYTATMKALTEKTQAAVNEARLAIKTLPASLESAIGEFSKQVDTVQHPILVNIVNAINTAEKTPNQTNVNAAKKAIPAELVPQWKNSYSAAVDTIQQGLIDKAVAAVKLAETDKTEENLKVAKELVADLLTADSEGIRNAVKALETRVNAIKIYDVNVTEVSISKTGVTVAFKALEEDVKDATLDVVDNKGKKVEVVAKPSLMKGETGYTFRFKTALSNRPEGTWTVNGVKINLDEVNLVADVIDASTAEKLYTILEESGLIKNLVDDLANQNTYFTQLTKLIDDEKVKTVADIQKAVDLGNEEAGSTVKISDLVTSARHETLNQFTTLFNKVNLDRVNSAWISDYKSGIRDDLYAQLAWDEVTLSDVQKSVDNVNSTNINEAVDEANRDLTSSKIQKAIELVEAYTLIEDDADTKEKAALLKSLNISLALYNINEADTKTELKSALKSLETAVADKTVFEYAKYVNEDLLQFYVDENPEGLTKPDSTNNIGVIDFLTDAETKAVEETIDAVELSATEYVGEKSETNKNDFLSKLNTLGKYSANVSDKTQRFDYSKVNINLIDDYATELVAITDAKNANTLVKGVNDGVVASQLSTATVENLLSRLRSNKLGLTNVIESNKSAYEAELGKFTPLTSISDVKTLVDSVNNLVTVKNSSDVVTVKNALTTIAVNGNATLTGYVEYSDAVRTDIAELLMNLMSDGKIVDSNTADVLSSLPVNDLTTLAAAITTATTGVNDVREALLADVNGTVVSGYVTVKPTTDETIKALNNISNEFAELSAAQKVSVAQSFNAKRPTKVINAGTDTEEVKTKAFTNFNEVRKLVSQVKTDLGL